MNGSLRRPWFTFSLRTLFVVVTLIAVYLGWAMNWIRERKAMIRICEVVNANHNGSDVPPSATPSDADAPLPLRALGERGVSYIDAFVLSRETFLQARELFPEARIVWWDDEAGTFWDLGPGEALPEPAE